MEKHFDVIVIGGGPAGYVAAIRLSQLGKKTMLIEKREKLGGTCLNVGCIPTKVLLESSEFFNNVKNHSLDFGINITDVNYDLQLIMKRKNSIVEERCTGVDFLIKKNKISRVHGTAKLLGKNSVEVTSLENGEKNQYTSEAIILATGSNPVNIPSIPFNGKSIISSDDAIALNSVPKDMIIIGAGAIGLELGAVWNRLGTKVTIVEMMPSLFGGIDRQMANTAQRILAGQGLNFMMEHRVNEVKLNTKNVEVQVINQKNETSIIQGDMILVAAGRKPYYENLGLENTKIRILENGRIWVDPETFETSSPGIYAIGDIIEGPMLAHKAEEEGVVVAERICGLESKVNYNTISSIIYTSPEVAWVGKGEDQLKSDQIEYNTGRFLFRANARAHALNEIEGMVKILANKVTDKILGIFIVGPRASELIAEASLAMKYEATVDDIIHTVHSHPTLSEVLKEAALDVKKRAIHS
ncbi:MAG: dihydrolipoyl dehydrogenase [Spirochaetia bacterium]|nr:dihydrolipoyl dehydrogenase [Spirochaetia bacterium]